MDDGKVVVDYPIPAGVWKFLGNVDEFRTYRWKKIKRIFKLLSWFLLFMFLLLVVVYIRTKID
jgi:hypothetical protein